MSLRYTGAWLQDGAFNPLASPPQQFTYYLNSWGRNNFGQLGLNNRTNYSSPKQVGSLTDWLKISSDSYTTAAIKTDGTLWSWGINSGGQLGLGNTTNYSSPKQVGSLTNWQNVSLSKNFGVGILGSAFSIKTDGTLWSWGRNNYGQLGLNNLTDYSSPKQVGSLTNWLSVSASYACLAVKTNGTLWSWGYNNSGELGLGDSGNYARRSSPTQVGALTNWKQVFVSNSCTVATKTDGTLWSWGFNGNGTLGLGNTTSYSSPKQIGALTNWSFVAATASAGVSIKTDGTLWSWGAGSLGQLGLGNSTFYSSPKQVGLLTSWLTVSTGENNMIALKY